MKLTEAIRRAGVSNSECARRAGIHRVQLQRYLAGKHRPELRNAERIAEALGVSLSEVDEFGEVAGEAGRQPLEEPQRRILWEDREVFVVGEDTPAWVRQMLASFAEGHPEQVRHLSPEETLAIEDAPELSPAPLPIAWDTDGKNGTGN
jgi:transcriptional regulator with XRE-family HTH domain